MAHATGAERWLAVPGYEGRYEISDHGRVRSLLAWRGRPGPRIINPTCDTHGYPTVSLYRDGERTTIGVHRLVLEAFVGPRPDELLTRHLDGDPSNNRLDNLTYGTSTENHVDQVRHGTHHHAAKTHCKNGHEFTPENTDTSVGYRRCVTCHRENSRCYAQRRSQPTI